MLQPKILNVEPMGSDKLRLYYENAGRRAKYLCAH